jgi:modulator of FtsH protease
MSTTAIDSKSVTQQTVGHDDARVVFAHAMGLVALTTGGTALGAYLARDFTGGAGIGLFVLALGAIFGLSISSARGHEHLAIGFLFALGLLLGASVGPVLAGYAKTDPASLWQAVGATAAFIAALGSFGYATRRDLSGWTRSLFWALLGLIAFGLVAIFVSIPGANTIYAALGLVVFGGFTVFDFNRLRRSGQQEAVPIAASIFLDVLNVFLLFLDLSGGERD